jgi:Ca-activated chloride channel family protein
VEALGPRDRLSLVSFDQAVDRHFEALAMDEAGQALACREIGSLRPGGMTDLGAGWHEGARCAALAIAEETHRSGHVIVLSDGRANQGITDPQELARHAGELALRGIKTSAVGIGDGYSPLQLDALAEAGQGRLHDADTPEDIVDVVLGELGELREVVAESLELTLEHPSILRAQVLTRVRVEQDEQTVIVPMGALRGGRTRTVALMFDVPALSADTHLDFSASLRWRDALTGEERRQRVPLLALGIVQSISAEAADRDLEVVRAISDLWEASLAYQAASVNERGDLRRAGALLAEVESVYWDWISALEDAEHRRSRFARMRAMVSRAWKGRSKRETLIKAKKAMRGERDLRVRETGEWHDYLGRR